MDGAAEYLVSGCVKIPATAAAVKLSRRLVSHSIGLWGLYEVMDAAELIVSELVTNAVRATCLNASTLTNRTVDGFAVIGVQLWVHRRTLSIEVWDSHPRQPAIKDADDDAEGGRGLLLVDALSDRWDVWIAPEGGKVVFAELSLNSLPVFAVEREAGGLPDLLRHGMHLHSSRENRMADAALKTRLLEGLAKSTHG